MKKKIVAVIDSGVDKEDLLLKDISIRELYYDKGTFIEQRTAVTNMHGTEIIKVLLRECSDMDIISIRTLHENNKCMLSDIINALSYCIELKVDIINLSLGSCTATAKRIDMLKDVCEKAVAQGIVIFAADHNLQNMKSYPANFDCVLGITTVDDLGKICRIKYKNKIVEFNDNHVHIPDSERCIIRRGNSYLCPLLAGLFCKFIGANIIDDNTISQFMDFLQNLSDDKNSSKIYFNKNTDPLKEINSKRMLFFTDDMDLNNLRLYNMYREVCDVDLCFEIIVNSNYDDIDLYVKNTDVFYFGALSSEFLLQNKVLLEKLISILEKNLIYTITVFPIVSTYNRICLTSMKNFQLKSIYK